MDWNNKAKIWAKVPTAKTAVTRACSVIDKLIGREYNYTTPAACEEARKRLTEAFDFCVDLHDRWSDLETEAGSESASEAADKSLRPYEEKQFMALEKLDEFISKNTKATAAPDRETPAATGTNPKVSTCKLLFPKELTKAKTPSEFRLWIAAFNRFYDASSLKQQPIATQQGYLLQALDTELQEVMEKQITPSMQIYGPTGCLQILENEFKTLYPIFNRRVDFFQVKRDQGENTEDFYRRLSKLGDMADLEAITKEELTTFRFIDACNDKRLRDKIFDLKRKDTTAIKETIAQYERTKKAEAALGARNATIATVKPAQNTTGNKRSFIPAELTGRCISCGATSHQPQDCNVRKQGRTCNNCGKTGHLARVCFTKMRGKQKQKQTGNTKPIRAIEEEPDTESQEPSKDLWVNRLTLNITHANGSFNFRTFPDTGSGATLIAADLAQQKQVKATERTNVKYINVSGDPVPTKGTAPITIKTQGRSANTKAVITPAIHNEIIIGRNDLRKLGVIPKQFPAPIFAVSENVNNKYETIRESLINENPDVITDDLPSNSMNTGCIDMKIHMTPGEKTPFRISTARQIPLHWREKAERIVKKLINGKVITPQNDPTEWCAPGFFVAKKNGDIRLVIDYTRLNKYIKRPVHTFPSTQEILAGIEPDSKVFAKLDATQGYHQVPLDEESSKLTTCLLPSGRFRFLRAPMGLSCSSDEFCRRSDKIIEGLPGVRKLVDDILVQAPDITTLHNRVNELIKRCKSHNFTLSRKKLEIGETVEFAGQIVSHIGVQPNPKYLQGIKDFPAPKNTQELRSFLGMVNQLATYHPGFAKHTGTLQALLKKDTAFLWMEERIP